MLIKTGLFHEGFVCHLSASAVAGFIAAIVGQPVDLIKTRVMNQNVGVVTVVSNILKNEVSIQLIRNSHHCIMDFLQMQVELLHGTLWCRWY